MLPNSGSSQIPNTEQSLGTALWETEVLPHDIGHGLPFIVTVTSREKQPNISTVAPDSPSALMQHGPLRAASVSNIASPSHTNQTAAQYFGLPLTVQDKFPLNFPSAATRPGRRENGFTTGTTATTDFQSQTWANHDDDMQDKMADLSRDVQLNPSAAALSGTFRENARAYTSVDASASSFSGPYRNSRPTHSRKAKASITSTTYNPNIASRAPRASQAQLSQAEVDVLLDTHVAPMTISLAPDDNTRMLGPMEHNTPGANARIKLNIRFFVAADGKAKNIGRREVYAHPYETRNQKFLHRLERMFGIGRLDRGEGPKPPRYRRISGGAAVNGILRKAGYIETPNSPLSTTSGSISASTMRSCSPGSMSGQDFVSTGASSVDEDMNTEDAFEEVDGVLDELKEGQNKIDFTPTRDVVEAWVATVQKLLKGKVRMDREDMKAIDKTIDDIVDAEDYIEFAMLKNTHLWESMTQLVLMDEISFNDEYELKARAEGVVESWKSKYAFELAIEA